MITRNISDIEGAASLHAAIRQMIEGGEMQGQVSLMSLVQEMRDDRLMANVGTAALLALLALDSGMNAMIDMGGRLRGRSEAVHRMMCEMALPRMERIARDLIMAYQPPAEGAARALIEAQQAMFQLAAELTAEGAEWHGHAPALRLAGLLAIGGGARLRIEVNDGAEEQPEVIATPKVRRPRVRKARQYAAADTLVTQKAFNGELTAKPAALKTAPGCTTYAALTIAADATDITGADRLTAWDRRVQNGVASLWLAGNRYMTAASIARTINGRTDGSWIAQAMQDAVIESVRRQQCMKITINYPDEAKRRGWDSLKLTGAVLPVTSIEAIAYGTRGYMIVIHDAPPLLTYAQQCNQLLRIPTELLDVRLCRDGMIADGERPRTGPVLEAVREYLLIRIARMHRNADVRASSKRGAGVTALTDTIRADTLYEITGTNQCRNIRSARKRVRDAAQLCLDYWRAMGWIGGYMCEMGGNSVTAWRIDIQGTDAGSIIPT